MFLRMRRQRRLKAVCLLFCLLSMVAWGDPGTVPYQVVIPRNAEPPLRLASRELVHYLRNTTGRQSESRPAADQGAEVVFELKIMPEKKLGEEGYRQNLSPRRCVISANTPRGVLYGTYAFIEEILGVRWFAPGDEYEFCPVNQKLTLPVRNQISVPDFSRRSVGYVWASDRKPLVKTEQWIARNRLQLRFNRSFKQFPDYLPSVRERDGVWQKGGHIMSAIVPDSLLGTSPELFALVDGRRIPQYNEAGRWISNPCLTHPEVVRRAVDFIEQIYALNPAQDLQHVLFHLGNNDVPKWCQCPRCRALDTPEELKNGSVTSRWVYFVNQVAAQIYRRHPETQLSSWAYQNYRIPSDTQHFDPRVWVAFCTHGRCYRHALNDPVCSVNQWHRAQIEKWAKQSPLLYERSYHEILLSEKDYFYVPVEKVMARDLRYYKSLGMVGYHYVVAPPDGDYNYPAAGKYMPMVSRQWNCLWPSLWIGAKLLWNVNLDYDRLYEDMGSRFYGRAWPAMKKYRGILTEAVMSSTGHTTYGCPASTLADCMDAGRFKTLDGLFREAMALASGDPAVSRRLKEERVYFDGLWGKVVRMGSASRQVLNAGQVREPIRLDGRLDDPSWWRVQAEGNFIQYNSGSQKARCQTYVKMLYDREALYFGIVAREPQMDRVLARVTEKQGKIWKDSCIEIFLGEKNGSYVHYLVNLNNAVFSQKYDAQWAARNAVAAGAAGTQGFFPFDGQVTAATVRHEDYYEQEIRIPIAPSGLSVAPGRLLPVNVARTRRLDDPRSKELSSWSNGIWNTPVGFRRVSIGRNLLLNGSFEKRAPMAGSNRTVRHPENWLANWGAAGEAAELIVRQGVPVIRMKNAMIYSYFYPRQDRKEQNVFGEIRASGRGTLKVYLSLRRHTLKIPLGTFQLTDKPQIFSLEPGVFNPKEEGYLYVNAMDSEAEVWFVNAALEDRN